MTVDDVVAALFRVLCDHQRAKGTGADMSLAEIRLARGQRYGFIRFGSRVDVYLPTDATPKVAVGDAAYATTTIIAELA